jgi:hypothetical protein
VVRPGRYRPRARGFSRAARRPSASALIGGRRGDGAGELCVLIHEVKLAVVVGVVVGRSVNDG